MPEFISITLLILLAAISPGPDFVMVTKNSLSSSVRAGLYTSLGISCSMLVHASYCILGFTIIISQSLLLFNIIKYIGAAYLIYIGLKSLFSKNSSISVESVAKKTQSNMNAFWQGLLCNLLNPKAIFFFIALFTIVIDPAKPAWVQVGYSLEIAVIHFIWFSLLSVVIGHPKVKGKLNRVQNYIVKAMGVVLTGFGIRIAFLSSAA